MSTGYEDTGSEQRANDAPTRDVLATLAAALRVAFAAGDLDAIKAVS
jgi:hypothetical protein